MSTPDTTALPRVTTPTLTDRGYGILLVVLGALGLVLSYGLGVVKLRLEANPAAEVSCDRGGVLMCSEILTSAGSAPLGFPNSFLGMSGFAVQILMGALVLGGARVPSRVWNGFGLGMRAGAALVIVFQVYSLGVLGYICVDCVVVWLIALTGFVYTRAYLTQHGHLRKPRPVDRFVGRRPLTVSLVCVGLSLVFVLVRALMG
ncbi:vitamin K epoxide reductase family protein [Streptomyces sp. NPDC004610]|uniref:vitamin K epoxide reductase family protein n=1 Tax=unclassified Streptomyces TaxID=2593676 RepID=UPI0033B59932